MSFSENLKTIRKEKNLSQEELAALLDVSRQAVSKWELGDGYPEAEKLLLIAEKLNVSLDHLMGTVHGGTETPRYDVPGQITITSPHEGVMVRCSKVVRSQKFRGGQSSPKYALFAQDQSGHSFWGATNTFVGWYMTEESILKEMEEIRQALLDGRDMYDLKYSVKTRRSFLSVKVAQEP
ncbi:MAG: helix-turn-helix transcriptional regulator [bacterium]|nr:helix-turn-helix transcriptional regulator [bacterium]